MKAIQKSRRGVLLLVIMGLLAMFGLVAIAFVMVAGQHSRSARSAAKVDMEMISPRQDCDQAFLQLVRGEQNAMSAINDNGLLEDAYGNDSVSDLRMSGLGPIAGGQLFEFNVPPAYATNPYPLLGRVLTMLSGPAGGRSTHIVGINAGGTKLQATTFASGYPNNNDFYMINGAPFSGTGAGYNKATGKLDLKFNSNWEIALLPNIIKASNGALGNVNDPFFPLAGGPNEDYDAVDYQNMFLATPLIRSNSTTRGYRIIPSFHRPDLIAYWAQRAGGGSDPKSFLTSGDQNLVRSILFRPHPVDHPFFPGNPQSGMTAFDPIDGPWDVDTDGDGIPDAIWIDLGMPVRSTADGRQYKPMFAIYCVDMDGRLNLNAHGTWAQTFQNYYNQGAQTASELPAPLNNAARFAGGANGVGLTTALLPRGQGMGPADVNLLPLFQGVTGGQPLTMYWRLLGGDTTQLDGRYGGYAELQTPSVVMPRPGFPATDSRAVKDIRNPLHYNRWSDYCGNYWGVIANPNAVDPDSKPLLDAYSTPPDMLGAGAIGLDLGGRPLWCWMADSVTPTWTAGELDASNPYKINLSRIAPHGATTPANVNVPDNPFSPAELERLLRPFDRDNASLPGRLAGLSWANNAPWLVQQRHLLTTESWDFTVPNLGFPTAALTDQQRTSFQTTYKRPPRSLTDLLLAKGVDKQFWRQLLPPEVLRGERLDLNRPFGNGFDDNANGTVDDPQEAKNNEQIALYRTKDAPATVVFDHINRLPSENADSFPGKDPTTGQYYTARELQARYLYVLAYLLCDMDYMQTVFDDGSGSGNGKYLACRYLAQWAVNVVDFRDRDSIMTRFVFVQNPFTAQGWKPEDPAANPLYQTKPEAYVVWGCERPELLLTEAIALHDRRTKDTSTDPSGKKYHDTDPIKHDDEDFDQVKKPLPSLFFELFNPWSNMDQQTGELHRRQYGAAKDWAGGVVLTQRTPQDAAYPGKENHPVWRVVVASAGDPAVTQEQPDLDHYDRTKRPQKVYSSIYFVDLAQATGWSDPDAKDSTGNAIPYYQQFFPDQGFSDKIAPVRPGRYMVVGPGSADEDYRNKYNQPQPTWIGEKKSMTDWATDRGSIRRITLQPDPNPDQANQVQVANNPVGGDPTQPPNTIAIQKAAAAVINLPATRRMGLTTPTEKDYPNQDAGASPATHTEKDGYTVPYNHPFDYGTDASSYHKQEVRDVLAVDGTTAAFRVLHLQRLANPLLPFDPDTNPYRTIDSLPVDLTVFNGTKLVDDKPDPGVTPGTTGFETRQRGEKNEHVAQQFNLWKQESVRKLIQSGAKALNDHVFEYEFIHTLGWLNRGRDANSVFGNPVASPPSQLYLGDPQQPFPWLTWNNRPFIGPLELLLVPAVHSSKLLARREEDSSKEDTAYYRIVHASEPPEPYDSDQKINSDKQQFPHLLNFFNSKASMATGSSNSMQLHRLLEYVTVPSRFAGVTVQGSPQALVGGEHWFHPPFNRIPTYREPGRINLNTIYYPEVFQGLINESHPTGGSGTGVDTPWSTFGAGRDANMMWHKFVQSRRGDGNVDMLDLTNVNMPSIFGRPFRSFAGGEMVPLDAMKPLKEIDATLLRSDPTEPKKPLFERVSTQHADNTNRSPYFRYLGYNKLANSVTTRSNVFAVWVTVGYFEVYPAKVDAGHPDGYEIRGELGSDTGEINRHRAFYLFDRSIPVGFQRGLDLNVENGILIRRYIE